MANFFERNSTKLTISEFYDNFKQKKYNFDAAYQRKSGVWSEDKRSFLIDSILKNYPIPVIFMRPIVDNNGKTLYDIVDGKQRLETIINFIEGKFPLTSYFSDDSFINDDIRDDAIQISGKTFSEIKEMQKNAYIKQFWTYTLQIEYLYDDNEDLISSVFDRLNRNGEPLTPQELRNAKYARTPIIEVVQKLARNAYLKDKFSRLKTSRMEDEEFVSELLFLVIDGKPLDSSPETLDEKYERYQKDRSTLTNAENKFDEIIDYIEKLSINYEQYKRLLWTTHLYTIFSVALHCIDNRIAPENFSLRLNKFYESYFSKNTPYTGTLLEYKEASSSRTRSAAQRKRRMTAIITYCTQQQIY